MKNRIILLVIVLAFVAVIACAFLYYNNGLKAVKEGNGEDIIVYKAGMYEPNVALPMTSISFPQGAPASVFIDYVVLEI